MEKRRGESPASGDPHREEGHRALQRPAEWLDCVCLEIDCLRDHCGSASVGQEERQGTDGNGSPRDSGPVLGPVLSLT